MDDISYSNIRKAAKDLDILFKGTNKVLAIDSSHFSKVKDDIYNVDLSLYSYPGVAEKYIEALKEYAKKSPYWERFTESFVQRIINFHTDWSLNTDKDIEIEIDSEIDGDFSNILNLRGEISPDGFDPQTVVNTLTTGKNKVGRCMIFVSKSFENKAQSIIYITLANEINGFNNELDYVKNDVRITNKNDELLIKNIFRILDELLISEAVHNLLKNYKDLELEKVLFENEKEFINANRHTINNIFSRINIDDILESCCDIVGLNTRTQLYEFYGQFQLLNLSIHAILNSVEHHPFEGKRISEILEFFSLYDDSPAQVNYVNKIEDEDSYLDAVIENDQLNDVFLVLWNLWHNAGKKHLHRRSEKIDFWVTLYSENEKIKISFKNHIAMDEKYILFLKKQKELPPEVRKRGLKIIRDRIGKLNWGMEIKTEGLTSDKSSKTEIKLTIN